MKFPIFLLAVFFALSGYAAGGGTGVVDNGGGYAEMLMVSLDQKLPEIFRALEASPTPGKQVRADLLEVLQGYSRRRPLTFSQDCDDTFLWSKPDSLAVPSCLLYERETHRSKDVGKLLALLVTARYVERYPASDATRIHQEVLRDLSCLVAQERGAFWDIEGGGDYIALRSLSLACYAVPIYSLLSLESKDAARDLSENFRTAVSCDRGNLQQLKMELEPAASESGYVVFRGLLTYQCNSDEHSEFEATLTVRVPFIEAVDLTASWLRVSGLRRLR